MKVILNSSIKEKDYAPGQAPNRDIPVMTMTVNKASNSAVSRTGTNLSVHTEGLNLLD